MGECPFCRGRVDEDLITFGGTCPKCFGDIPGEEAATDPGEDVKAAQARSDEAHSRRKAMIPILLAMPLVGAAGMAALWFGVLRPEPEVLLLDFDEFEDYPMPELVAAAEPEPETAEQGGVRSPTSRKTGPAFSGGNVDLEAGIGSIGEDAAVADAGGTRGTRGGGDGPMGAPTVDIGPTGGAASQAGLDFGIDVSAKRRGAILEDPEAIRKMIGDRMRAQAPRLQGCYENELKTNETLSGRWRVKFTVTQDGKTDAASAVGVQSAAANFESCLAREVGKWTFQRISRDQPVQKTFTFRPRG